MSALRRMACWWVLVCAAAVLLPCRGVAQADPVADEAAIQALFDDLAVAFSQKDEASILGHFGRNFAGPFRIPMAARMVLQRVLQNAATVEMDWQLDDLQIQGSRALAVADVRLVLGGEGDNQQDLGAMVLVWLDRTDESWVVTDVQRLTDDWAIPAQTDVLTWDDEAVRFAMPPGWQGFRINAQQTRRSVLFVSPDLKAVLALAIGALPMEVTHEQLIAQFEGIPRLFPGSRFLGSNEGTLAGSPAIVTRADMAVGPSISRAVSLLMLKHRSIYVFTLAVTPSTDAEQYMPVFKSTWAGFRFLGEPEAAVPHSTGRVEANRYANTDAGIMFDVPEGWSVQPMDDAGVQSQGWLFGVTLQRGRGGSHAIIGARDLNGRPPMDALRRAEMGNIRMVDEEASEEDARALTVDGQNAITWRCRFEVAEKRIRRYYFVMVGTRLFFVIADAVPATELATLERDVAAVVRSMKLSAP